MSRSPHRMELFEAANAAYDLTGRFHGTRAVAVAHDETPVVVFDGDTRLDCLELDWHELDKQLGIAEDDAVLGVVVTGNLVVDRYIMNWDMSFGPFLYVQGSVTVGDLAGGGSEIEIEGSATIARTLHGFYNHGRIAIRGDARAEVIVVEEHLIEIGGTATAAIATGGNFLRAATPQFASTTGRYGAPPWRDLDPALFDRDDWSSLTREDDMDVNALRLERRKILKAQAAGRSLLRDSATPWPVA